MKNLVVTGKAGSGKSTLIQEVTLPFRDDLGGFVTREMRENGQRVGFEIVAFDGRRGVFASKRIYSKHKLNKYGVDLRVLEEIGVDSLASARKAGRLIVVDEIGTMEMMSEKFRAEIARCLGSDIPVLATVRAGSNDFAGSVKELSDTEILELTREDFNVVRDRARAWLEEKIGR